MDKELKKYGIDKTLLYQFFYLHENEQITMWYELDKYWCVTGKTEYFSESKVLYSWSEHWLRMQSGDYHSNSIRNARVPNYSVGGSRSVFRSGKYAIVLLANDTIGESTLLMFKNANERQVNNKT